jgi:hypothetical protein
VKGSFSFQVSGGYDAFVVSQVIIFQCLNEMPEGPYKSTDGKVSPPSR